MPSTEGRGIRDDFISLENSFLNYMSESTAFSGQDTIQETFLKRIAALESDTKNLAEELETTRVEREEVRAKLFESLIANKKYLREVERLKKENILLKRMPLFLATVVEMGPDYVLAETARKQSGVHHHCCPGDDGAAAAQLSSGNQQLSYCGSNSRTFSGCPGQDHGTG